MPHHPLLPRWLHALIPLLLLGLLVLSPAAPLRAAGVIYVVPGGAGAQTGADWANAKDLQAALQSATSGDQLWVKAGSYRPTTSSDRSATFQLKSGVALYGGFAGSEDSLGQRVPSTYISTLSGDLLDNDAGAVASNNVTRGDNSYHVVTGSGTDATAVLDGFTITAGNANGNSLPNYNGGGLSNLFGNPTIRNTLFIGNSAANAGGGVDNDNSLSIFDQVRFSENTAYSGGAMFNFYSNVTISFAIFSQNTSMSDGGGLYNYASDASISHSLFVGNSGSRGGGMLNTVGLPTISQTTFTNNSATNGGAIANVGGATNPIIQNAILWGNVGGQIFDGPNDQPIVRFALVQGGYSSGTDIIDADPLFVDAEGVDNIAGTLDDDLRLQAGSPAIDAGNNAFIPLDLTDENNNSDVGEPAPFDLDGNARLDGAIVDLGAYESQLHLYITSAPPPAGIYGSGYSHTFTASALAPVIYSISSGNLPPGLTLDTATGMLSGTPTAAGSYSGITVTASNAGGSANQTFTIVIHPALLTISANNKVKHMGVANPVLTASYSGFVNGDTPASLDAPVILTTTATIASAPGAYPITAGGAADTNYTITFTHATLTITSDRIYMALVRR